MRAKERTDTQTVWETSHPLISLKLTDNEEYLRILHVDDDSCLLEVSKQILLMENNFEIDAVSSVDEAFEKLEKQTYDAVVSDYEMPQKNGLEFLKELREQNNQIPFILFTGKGREDVVVKALNLGADSYINKNGSPETVYCELADAINKTIERKKSKKALAESELKYRTVVEKSLQGILITQTSPLRLVFANESMGNILGYSTEELKSLSPEGIAGLIYDEDRTVFFKRLESRMRCEQAPSSLEFRAVRKNGSIVWLEAFASRIEYMGQPAVQGIFLDIDERKKAREILRESEERYRELANSLPDIVFESDTTGHVVFVNERAPEISGYSRGEIEKGLNILQFLAPEDRQRAMKSIQRLLAGGSYVPDEYVFLRKDGTTFPALITTTLRISKNKVTGLRGLILDITERKKAEESVRKSGERYLELANFLPETVFETDLTGNITFFSQGSFELTGFTKEKLEKGRNLLSFVVPEDLERAKENLKKVFSGEKRESNEFTLYKKNGDTYPAIVSATPIFSEGRAIGIRGLVIDITERKKAEEVLLKAEREKREILDSMREFVAYFDMNQKIMWANKALCNWLSLPAEKVIGQTCLEINSQPELCDHCPVVKTLKTGQPENAEVTLPNGKLLWMDAYPILDKTGQIQGAVEISTDITEYQKTAKEISSLNEKLDVLGKMTRHDIKNKLQVINNHIFIAERHGKNEEGNAPEWRALHAVKQASLQIGEILNFAKDYEMLGSEELKFINVAEVFSEAVALSQGLKDVKVVNDCGGLSVLADSLLRELFYNLVDNSLKYGETITQIHCSFEENDKHLRLIYEDDGVGIPLSMKQKLFTKGFGKGTGLGLYLIKKMTEVYGWSIVEEGVEGKGVKFIISIPKKNGNGNINYQI
jgi:PAS domain S-box-containing protein